MLLIASSSSFISINDKNRLKIYQKVTVIITPIIGFHNQSTWNFIAPVNLELYCNNPAKHEADDDTYAVPFSFPY